MKHYQIPAVLTVLGILLLQSSFAETKAASRKFLVKDEKARDLVSFESDAPLELIQGKTHKIEGEIEIDESLDLSKNCKASFDLDLASIDTGIELRNEHMRDNFLETRKYPKASFVLKKFLNPPETLKPGQKVSLKAQGDFSCHGKTVSKVIPVQLSYFSRCPDTESKRAGCDLLQIKAVFPVNFQDHSIKRPTAVFKRLADSVIVTVSATAYNQVIGSSSKEAESDAATVRSK